MVKVFFNNSCNICRAEINHYKKYSEDNVEWVDVTDNQEAQKITSKSYKELLRRMHVIQDGKVIDGAESFLIIWKNIPKYNFLYKLFNNKPMFFLLKIFYEIAAYFLFLKNKHLLKEWKKKIYQQRFAQLVNDLLPGEKNGNLIGQMSNFVQRDVQGIKLIKFKLT